MAKSRRVALRFVLEGRVADWRARSGRALVSKVACIEVGFEAERIFVVRDLAFIW